MKPVVKNKPFFPELKTTSLILLATTTLTGLSLTAGIGSDLMCGNKVPSYMNKKSKTG